MVQQNVKEQAAIQFLTALMDDGGKRTIQQIRDELKSRKYIELNIEDIELEYTRKLIGKHRNQVKRGDSQLELGNLTENVDDGRGNATVVHYYKLIRDMTLDESYKLLVQQHRVCDSEMRKLSRYYWPAVEKHGKKLQKMLPFAPPPRLEDEDIEAQKAG